MEEYLRAEIETKVAVMACEGVNGIESGSAGADPLSVRVGHGKGDRGDGDPAHALGPPELPVVELGLVGTGSREDDGVPRRNPRWVAYRQPETVPRFTKYSGQVRFLLGSLILHLRRNP